MTILEEETKDIVFCIPTLPTNKQFNYPFIDEQIMPNK